MTTAVCKGCWGLNTACGRCERCKQAVRDLRAERDALRALLEEFATFCAESGWHSTAEELRRRAREARR